MRLLTLGCLMALLTSINVSGEETMRTIRVVGEGKATGTPDMATIQTGVVTQAATAKEAMAANSQAMRQILDALQGHGVASKDVQTSNLNVQPEYERDARGRTKPQIVGYRVTNQVRVRVRNLPQLGDTLDAVVQAGSNQIHGISFSIDNQEGLLNQARNRAIRDARSRAELYAHAADVQVGKVLAISEQPIQVPRPQMLGRAAAMEAAGVPIASGEQELSVRVHVEYELRD